MKRLLPILAFVLLLSACETEVLPSDPSALVIDGWIDSGSAPVVMVTTTVEATSEKKHISSLSSHVIKTARVTIVSEGDTVLLHGHRDDRYTPPFIYTTEHMRGVPGRSYALKVVHGSHVATAQTRIPEPEPLDGLTAKQESDTLTSLTATFMSRQNSYYKFFTRIEGVDSAFCPSMLAVAEGNGNRITLPVLRGWHLLTKFRQPLFHPGERVHVKFCTMESALYDYWCTYDDVSSLARNILFPAKENAKGNVKGGYGCWAGYGVQEYVIDL